MLAHSQQQHFSSQLLSTCHKQYNHVSCVKNVMYCRLSQLASEDAGDFTVVGTITFEDADWSAAAPAGDWTPPSMKSTTAASQ